MALLQGSTYKLPIKISGANGVVIADTMVQSGVFQIGGIEKRYGEGGEVWYDGEQGCWILPLSERDTFALMGVVEWQARFVMNNGEVAGTRPKMQDVYDSINKTELTGGGEGVGE